MKMEIMKTFSNSYPHFAVLLMVALSLVLLPPATSFATQQGTQLQLAQLQIQSTSTGSSNPGSSTGDRSTGGEKKPAGSQCSYKDGKLVECTCDGVLDCNDLFSSGDCEDKPKWQDPNDSSKGGCG